MTTIRPPRLGRLLLRLRPLRHRRDEIEADFLELFHARAASKGRRVAARRYILDALSLWRFGGLDRPPLLPKGIAPMTIYGVSRDVRFALRLFRKQPGLFGLTIAGLAFAIGIGTSTFSIVNSLALRGTGIAEPQRFVQVSWFARGRLSGSSSPFQGNWSHEDFSRARALARSVDLVAAASWYSPLQMTANGIEPGARGLAVTGDFFQATGAHVHRGRALAPADDAPDAPDVVVISEALWLNRFNSDPSIVGRPVWIARTPFVIVGVMSRDFQGAHEMPPAYWIPLASGARQWARDSARNRGALLRSIHALEASSSRTPAEEARLSTLRSDLAAPPKPWNPPVDVFGRLRPGGTLEQVTNEMRAMTASLLREAGEAVQPDMLSRVTIAGNDAPNVARGMTAIVMTLVSLVILLACANVANVLLAGAAARGREIGTRLALGASHWRVARQLLTESLLLGALGGLVGLTVALWALPSIARAIQIPESYDIRPDLSVYAVVAAVTVLASLVAGLAPARHCRRVGVLAALKTDQPGATRHFRSRIRSLLLGSQATIAMVLLVLASLLTRSLLNAAYFDAGFDVDHVVAISGTNGTNGRAWSDEEINAFSIRVVETLRNQPGISGVALASTPPFSGISAPQRLPGGLIVQRNETTADYFTTLGVPFVRGRAYTAEEVARGAAVAVVSESFARAAWGSANPLGRSLDSIWGEARAEPQGFPDIMRRPRGTVIVGVARDILSSLDPGRVPGQTIYLPLGRQTIPRFIVRTTGDPHASAQAIRNAIASVNPDAGSHMDFATDQRERQIRILKIAALAGLCAGVSALGLAVIGLFGVTAFIVTERRHELAVRVALGATRTALLRMLLVDSLRPVAIGLILGLALSLAAGQILQYILFATGGRDPVALIAAVFVLLAAATVAVLGPSRRALAQDPTAVLKQT